MTFALSTDYRLSVNAETTWGVPVTTGARFLRIVSADLSTDQQVTESEEITAAHRETSDVVAVSRKGMIQVEGEMSYNQYEAIMIAALGGTVTGTTTRVMRVGKTLKSLTFQEEHPIMAPTNHFTSYNGAIVTGFNIGVRTGQRITFGFSASSRAGVVASASAIGTVAAANLAPVMSPIASVQALTDAGAAIVGCTNVSLSITNDLIELPSLLTADPLALYAGRFRLKGSLSVYKRDAVLLNKFLGQTSSVFTLRIGGSTTAHYLFTLPLIKYSAGKLDGVRGSTALTETFAFDALFDATSSSFQITATD
jgi:hypothetical protein